MVRMLGDVIARGTRSSVHAYGRGAVIKIPAPSTPDDWIAAEARYSAALADAGAPAPRLLGVESHGGRIASVWERIAGPSMWECALRRPERREAYGRLLAELQLALFDLVPPVSLPRQRDRLMSKIRRSAELVDPALTAALDRLPDTSRPARVCHGDLHPGNVILADTGPVIVDWFDVARGDALADVARSTLLMPQGAELEPPGHLPGADDRTLGPLARAHLARLRETLDIADGPLEHWRAVEAVARMAEGVPTEALLALWRRFETSGDAGAALRAASGEGARGG